MKRTSRKSEITRLDQEIRHMLKSYRIEEKFDETRLIASWEKIMGKTIARRTKRVHIHDRKLFIEVDSAPLRNELALSKSRIMALFFNEFEKAIVDDIIIK